MPNLEDLASSDSRVLRYVCLQPWEREERPLEEQPRVHIEPPDEYADEEPGEEPYDHYKPKRGIVIIQY